MCIFRSITLYICRYIFICIQADLNSCISLLVFNNTNINLALRENAEALVAATMETGLEVSADKTKYKVMSRDQNAGRILSVRIDNSTFEWMEVFKYLGKI